MTSTTDMAEHPDVAEISDLTEGLLPAARSADVRRHLDECALCADVHASLEEIRDLLGTAPGPPRMPAEVAGRIDAALAAEALLHATAPEPKPEAAGEPTDASPASSDDDPGHVSRETPASQDRPAGRPRSTTTGPGRKSRLRGGRRRVAVLGTVFTVAALGLGSVVLSSLNDGTGQDEGTRTTASDTFSEGKLEKQVTDLLAQSQQGQGKVKGPGTVHTLGSQSESDAVNPRVLKEPAVPKCVSDGIGRNDAALATETGTYKGKDALLVVLPDPSDDTRVTAYIVEATCVDNPSAATTAKVLLKHSYTRS
ncbi:anti-sigma factor family protein [Streptomyces sp. NPDC051740]|uniref:anti-sigma factor family protein n=1 Tax=Streptomyces sp. NPDC051740 TaxID=3365673 RepID=UPI003788E1ED